MPRKSIGETAMTDAERQARYRAARTAGKPAIRIRRPADHRSRARRWCDAVAELADLQMQYATWLDALPANFRDSTTVDALQAICDVDLTDRRSNRHEALAGTDRDNPASCRKPNHALGRLRA